MTKAKAKTTVPNRPGAEAAKNGAARSARVRRGRPRPKAGRDYPCTGLRYYDDEESAFLAEVRAHQERTGRRFLLQTDYLEVLKRLGYRREVPGPTGPDSGGGGVPG